MGKIIAFKKPNAADRHRGNTLCRRGFHKWTIVDTPFDSREGKLVTRYRCDRCGKEKTEARSR